MSTFTATTSTFPAAAGPALDRHPHAIGFRPCAQTAGAQPPGGGASGGDPDHGPRRRLAMALDDNR